MKFMVTWRLHEESRHETLAMFSQLKPEQEADMLGDAITILGRWHDLVGGTGVAILESNSAEAISAYSLQWNRSMDLEITPVLDDDEARALGQALPESQDE